jgi:hypothetical protein
VVAFATHFTVANRANGDRACSPRAWPITTTSSGTKQITAHIVGLKAPFQVTGAEMFKLPSDANDPSDPNYIPQYVACYDSDPNAYVVLTAQLDPPSDDPELLAMLQWQGNGQPDPNDRRKFRVPMNIPTQARVTATLGDASVSADVWVVRLDSITLADAEITSLSRTNPPDANDLYVPEDPNGQAHVEISADVAPSDAGRSVSWVADGSKTVKSEACLTLSEADRLSSPSHRRFSLLGRKKTQLTHKESVSAGEPVGKAGFMGKASVSADRNATTTGVDIF